MTCRIREVPMKIHLGGLAYDLPSELDVLHMHQFTTSEFEYIDIDKICVDNTLIISTY